MDSIHDFAGKVALVTGGASGIGLAAARLYAAAGVSVMIIDRDEMGGQAAVQGIVADGGSAAFRACDVTAEDEVAEAITFTVDHFGSLNCAFNNAGIEGASGVHTANLSTADWTRILGVNLTSVFLCMKFQLAYMAEHGGGTIVNTSSTAGLAAAVNSGVAYAASKHGVIGLTKTAAKEYIDKGVRINAICPGGVTTPLLERTLGKELYSEALKAPSGYVAAPEQIAEAVLWLSSSASQFVNGQAIALDGGRIL